MDLENRQKRNTFPSNESDIQILKQLYFGNHLESNDLERAVKLLHLLNIELKGRI